MLVALLSAMQSVYSIPDSVCPGCLELEAGAGQRYREEAQFHTLPIPMHS